ncbi:type VII secretion-associated serine protease mycosin [Mycolicibacterium sp. S2-37]|uniref:type VII secretion-associated serine protease mycosin n=1 Tax=Mycolicibacterium sp. S2-37 TaxID=2810297 RepID=UPI001A9476AA|nr:type VII secretion-associated serine protease mycosin [Mycolicibacterium sp. S2-37]MBO0677352.1 type VII secretion-associated serine protease mycosin [Mycolicibacterium sp. S2-37]
MQRTLLMMAALALFLLSAPPATAVAPPSINPDAVPPDQTGPDMPMVQRRLCAAATTLPDSNFQDAPWTSDYLGLPQAQQFATGAGVTVAVIDTGVNVSARLSADAGGDFVTPDGDGLSDCDAHGTLTASIINGRPSPDDAFVGVAPDARVISLRHTSEAFDPEGAQQGDGNDPNATPAAGSVRSLARAVVHAANLGAGVINVSEAACFKVTRQVDESTLGAALNYAVNVKGAVVVVAAGNTGGDCVQNPPPDPSKPDDPRGWDEVQTIVTPAWYAPLVLTVGGIGTDGSPSGFSMHGPWVGVAAPAEGIVALGSEGQPVNALQGADAPVPLAGTSFSAAFVSGLAALLRQRFPALTPAQIINRIVASARHPGGGVDNVVGAGVIYPVAALTWDIPPGPVSAPFTVKRVAPPVAPIPPDRGPIKAVALAVGAVMLALGLVGLGVRAMSRR